MKILILILFLLPLTCLSQDFYASVNQIRKEKGLQPLEVSSTLENKAERYLKTISKYPGLVHSGEQNVTELLCETSGEALTLFMSSKAHRMILMSKNYKKIGIARVGNRYCVRLN